MDTTIDLIGISFTDPQISHMNYATCYDATIHRYHGKSCFLLPTKWCNVLDLSEFSKLLDNVHNIDRRTSLIDSIVLQLYTIIAQFQEFNSNNESKNNRPRKVDDDINHSMIAIALDKFDDNHEIADVLLLIPFKEVDLNPDYDNDLVHLDTISVMQTFFLQVFLMRLMRLVSDNNPNQTQTQHYHNAEQRTQHYSSLEQLRLLCAVDVFHINQQTESNVELMRKQVSNWFTIHSSSNYLSKYFNHNTDFVMGTIFDYLKVDFVSTTNVDSVVDLLFQKIDNL